MHKISISISDRDLGVIDDFCNRERYSRSQLLIKGAMHLIETSTTPVIKDDFNRPQTLQVEKKPLGRCEYEYCKGVAVGRFHWKYFDNSAGESFEKDQSLCEFHRNLCKSQMEKIEGEFYEN